MENGFESDLGTIDEELLKYIGITNLDFSTPITADTLEEVKKMLFSINTVAQVTFRDQVQVRDIETIKHVLELSPMITDSSVEKLVLRDNNPDEVKELLSFPYENPDSWKFSYSYKDGTYQITTLPNYRMMEEYINIVILSIDKKMSPLEKVKEVYDFVKLLDLDRTSSDRLPDIVRTRKTNSLGFNNLFKEILSRLNIPVYIVPIKRDDTEYVSVIYIEDSKYEADGFYFFDPASDSLPKSLYKNEAFRKINYNFFALTINQLLNTIGGKDKLLGAFEHFVSSSYDFVLRKIKDIDKRTLEELFNMDLLGIYSLSLKTKPIKEANIWGLVINTLHREDYITLDRNIEQLIISNYRLRKEDIFRKDTEEDTTINIHDI
ncbi:MAG: hypothetical protein IKQ35_05775 [Bacilli bacterium]|nr:hypothetical protein [Bacilli bacterium]